MENSDQDRMLVLRQGRNLGLTIVVLVVFFKGEGGLGGRGGG